MFDRHVHEGARQLDRELNNYLRTQNSDSLPAAQKTSINGYNDAASEVKFRAAVYEWITDQALAFDRNELPMMERVIFGAPEFCKAAVDFLVLDKPNLGAGTVVDEAYREFGVVKIAGWNIVKDNLFPLVADNAEMAHAGLRGINSGLVFGEQWANFEAARAFPLFHGDIMGGLYVYTAKRMVDDRVATLSHGTIATAL